MRPLPAADLDHVVDHTRDLWAGLKGARIFLTGGTGFVGSWLAESGLHASRKLGLGIELVLLTRNQGRTRALLPHLVERPEVTLLEGDLKTCPIPGGTFDFALHVATETRAGYVSPPAGELLLQNLAGMARFLEIVRDRGARRFLFTSSGAVYGPQSPAMARVAETEPGAPDPLQIASAYGESKRACELLCAEAHAAGHAGSVARCFAFVGPRLPLDANYAIGNFIREAMGRTAIRISGDGTPRRSYLYAADLAAWLWTILVKGQGGQAYNVGSEADHAIKEIAECVRDQLAPTSPIEVARTAPPGVAAARYIPDTTKARGELGLAEWIDLPTAIRQTGAWYAGA